VATFRVGRRFAFEKFRIYTDGRGSKYYTVFVFADKHAMYVFRDEWHEAWGVKKSYRFEAECVSWKWKSLEDKRMHKRDIGCVIFHLGFIGSGVVSHEMTHAALFWRRKRHSDERVCRVQGELVRQFWLKYYRANLHRRARLLNA